jgi:quercetin dioxygenase-like cupin family protein
LTAGQSLEEHENPGEATVHVLTGRIRLVAGDSAWDGRTGGRDHLPDSRRALEAIQDAAVLLTVAQRS